MYKCSCEEHACHYVDGKVYTSTEETPVYSSWYESLPYRATVGFKTFSKISITKD